MGLEERYLFKLQVHFKLEFNFHRKLDKAFSFGARLKIRALNSLYVLLRENFP